MVSYFVWLFATRTAKLLPHLWYRPQDVIHVPAFILFGYYFSIMKIYALLTLHEVCVLHLLPLALTHICPLDWLGYPCRYRRCSGCHCSGGRGRRWSGLRGEAPGHAQLPATTVPTTTILPTTTTAAAVLPAATSGDAGRIRAVIVIAAVLAGVYESRCPSLLRSELLSPTAHFSLGIHPLHPAPASHRLRSPSTVPRIYPPCLTARCMEI